MRPLLSKTLIKTHRAPRCKPNRPPRLDGLPGWLPREAGAKIRRGLARGLDADGVRGVVAEHLALDLQERDVLPGFGVEFDPGQARVSGGGVSAPGFRSGKSGSLCPIYSLGGFTANGGVVPRRLARLVRLPILVFFQRLISFLFLVRLDISFLQEKRPPAPNPLTPTPKTNRLGRRGFKSPVGSAQSPPGRHLSGAMVKFRALWLLMLGFDLSVTLTLALELG